MKIAVSNFTLRYRSNLRTEYFTIANKKNSLKRLFLEWFRFPARWTGHK